MRKVLSAIVPAAALAFAHLALAQPALAQAESPSPASDGAATQSSAPPLVVRGLRLRDADDLPVASRPSTAVGAVGRQIVADADRFARCAGLPRDPLLRRIVDGRPATGETEKALHQHIMRNSGCYKSMPLLGRSSPYYGECNAVVLDPEDGTNVCRVTYDRGRIYEQVLHQYASDLRLSRSNTFDLATQDYFRTREEQRNSARRRASERYFWAVSCMVQVRPEYALDVLDQEPGSAEESRLIAMMIADGRKCIGGDHITEVTVDPGQFRAFVAESVYGWAVAVKRADSLLPAEGNG